MTGKGRVNQDPAFAASRPSQRLDKFLWQARFLKSRTAASVLVAEARVRVNGERTSKPAHPVGPGDVLTFPQSGTIRVIRILALPTRRGPASEAVGHYHDLEIRDDPVP